MSRTPMPNRRSAVTDTIAAGGITAHATVGMDANGRALEVFLRPTAGARLGSAVDRLVDDIAIVLSVALQHGITPEDLSRSLYREPAFAGSAPASIVGAALDLVAKENQV